jgi:uncharacterized Zn-finger protein
MKRKTLNQIKKELEKQKYKQRDKNIQKHISREINLSTRTTKNKKIYSRKVKHKNKDCFIKFIKVDFIKQSKLGR